jgi:hypothetical protein
MALALLLIYSPPDPEMLQDSHNTVWLCWHGGGGYRVVKAKQLFSVVGMIPDDEENDPGLFFLVEKLGLEVAQLGGAEDELTEGVEGVDEM